MWKPTGCRPTWPTSTSCSRRRASRAASKPPGTQCSEGAENVKNFKFCAYHSYFNVGAATYIYADNPYVETPECVAESPNESPSDHAISGGLAHEHSESVTDPEISGWFNEKKEEVADRCRSANPAEGTRRAARHGPRRRPLQPADQRRRVPLPADVEQRTGRLRAARGAAADRQETRPEEGPHVRRHARHDRRERRSSGRSPSSSAAPRGRT